MLVDGSRCVGCGACVPYCPNDALSVLGAARIDIAKCMECRLCISYCAVEAISGGVR